MGDTAAERLSRLEQRMGVVEEGVANFRDFQVFVRKFIDRADQRAEMRIEEDEQKKLTDKKRARFHFWLLGILSGIIIAGFASLFTWLLGGDHHVVVNPDHAIIHSTNPQDAVLPQAYVKQ